MAEHQASLQHTSLPTPAPGANTAWVRQVGVSDTAVALYAVLLQCSDRGGGRMPTTQAWAARLPLTGGGGGGAGYAVGMAIAELVGCGTVGIGYQPVPGHLRAGAHLLATIDLTVPGPAVVAGSGHRPNHPSTTTLPAAPTGGEDGLAAVEAALDACDGLRPILQQRARDQLTAEGVRLTRAAVLYRAHTLLRQGAPGENPGHGPSHAPIAGAHTGRGAGGGW